MKENLIELILSDNPDNYEIFHQFYDLDIKLEALQWFWDVKCHELPLVDDINDCIHYIWFETNIILGYGVVLCENLKVEYQLLLFTIPTGELVMYRGSPITIQEIQQYFVTLITTEHEKRHGHRNITTACECNQL